MAFFKYKKQLPVIGAMVILLGLTSILLALNYHAQVEVQQKIDQRIQGEVDAGAERLQLRLQHLLSETSQEAQSPEVNAFFKNRALGMSMEYGLNASLHVIDNLFSKRAEGAKSPAHEAPGKNHGYERIILLDRGLQVLTAWPERDCSCIPDQVKAGITRGSSMISWANNLYLICKVEKNLVHHGYVIGVVSGSAIFGGLFPAADSDRITLVSHEGRIVYPDLSEQQRATLARLLNIEVDNSTPNTHPSDAQGERLSARIPVDPIVFSAMLPQLAMCVYQVEGMANLYEKNSPIQLLVVMLLFSTSLIVLTLRLVRSSTRNQALNENLEELKKGKAALADKNSELELIISGAEVGTWVWDVDSGRIHINDQWAHMLGYEKDEIDENVQSWVEKVHPQDWPAVQKALDKYLQGEISLYKTDHRLKHKSGKWVWVRDVGQTFDRDTDGNPQLIRGIHIDITELKTALQSAEESRREADSVIRNFLDSMLVVDRHMKITRINRETCLLLRYQEDELVGSPISDIFAEPAHVVHSFFNFPFEKTTRDKEELRNIQLTFKKRSTDETLPVSINLSRLVDDGGATIGVVAGAKDVSALNQALKNAEEQKQFIRDILDIIPGGILVLDRRFNLVQSNRTFERLVQKWSGAYEFQPDALEKKIIEQLAVALKENDSGEFSLSNEHQEMIVEYHASGSETQTEKLTRVVFIHDVTSRHFAEATRKLHSTVLEQTSEGVVITDTNGIILYANLAVQNMCGYTFNELDGRKTSVFKSGVQDEAFYQGMWHTIESGNVWTGSITNRAKDSSLFEVEMTISPVRANKDTQISHYVSLWRDVSHERTLQQQLLQAQKLEAVGQLAAGIAHEINTPIQYIQNNLVFFQDAFADIDPLLNLIQTGAADPQGFDAPEWRTSLQQMVKGCDLDFLREDIPQGIADALDGVDHVTRIVGAMKEFSHPGNVCKVAADFNKLIENAILVTRNEWKYNAELKTNLDENLPPFSCDSGLWSQVVLNLIVNSADAIKDAHDKFTGLIQISTTFSNGYIELRISDNGAGIPADLKDRIFEPFFTTKDVGKGTGQGLAIVYDIVVNKHNGTIQCDSTQGQGTTITIRVPVCADDALTGETNETHSLC